MSASKQKQADQRRTEFVQRMERLSKQVSKNKLDAFFIQNPVNRYYFTGLHSSVGVLVVLPKDKPLFYTDFRYLEMAKKSIDGVEVRGLDSLPDQFDPLARKLKLKRVGFEGSWAVNQLHSLQRAMPSVEDWVECEKLILDLRVVKSKTELAIIRQAVKLCDEVFKRTVEEIRPGMTEWEIRRVLRGWVDQLDAEEESFDCIISVGANSSKPHAHVTQDVWKKHQPLLIDMGVRLDGYCSDMTRMVFAQQPSDKMKKIYDIVLSAQLKAIDAIKPGLTGRKVDAVARNYIEKRGYGKNFGHGLGHGVGLEIHENPRFNHLSDQVLEPGMVVTVEPGIYLPGVGGVRIEDMVIVTKSGCEILTKTTKEVIIVGEDL